MTVHISENWGDLINPAITKFFVDQYREIPQEYQSIFGMETTNKPFEQSSSAGAAGDFEPFNGTVPYDETYQGYDVKYEFPEFVKGLKIERKLYEDDLTGIMHNRAKALAIAAARTKDKYAVSIFVNSFGDSGSITVAGQTVLTHSEGKSLCDDSHTTPASSSTQDNKLTAAFSATAVEATRRLGGQVKDDRDNLIDVEYDLILVPEALHEKAWELISSAGKVDTANNNRNFHYGKYKLMVWKRLSSSTDWWMLDSRLAKMFLKWYTRVPLEFKEATSLDTLIKKWVAYERYGWGYDEWRFVMGHDVA